MSVTTPSTGQKISDFSAGNVDANSYFIQANSGSTSKVSASQIGQFSNLNLLFSQLDTDNKTIVGAINEINRKDASDISYDNTSSGLTATDVNAAIDEVNAKTGSDIAVSSSSSETIAEMLTVSHDTYFIPTYGGTIDCYRQGNAVSVICKRVGADTPLPQGAFYDLATIDVKYRPKVETWTTGFSQSNLRNDSMTGYIIETSGKVRVYAYSPITFGAFVTSFIVD